MGNDTPSKLDLSRALNDAVEVYKRNFLTFILAALLLDLLSIASLLVLTGPLWGAIVLMTLRAMSDPKAEVRLGDIFSTFNLKQFGPLVALCFLTAIPILLGLVMLVIPGLVLMTLWMFPTYLMVDQNLGVWDSIRTSGRIVLRRGFWINAAAAFVIFALCLAPSLIPGVGFLISLLVAPLAWLINTSCYIQEVREQYDVTDFAPRGFPVGPPPFAQAAPQG
jgi:hypothetical protein